jgi:hypothetical protein
MELFTDQDDWTSTYRGMAGVLIDNGQRLSFGPGPGDVSHKIYGLRLATDTEVRSYQRRNGLPVDPEVRKVVQRRTAAPKVVHGLPVFSEEYKGQELKEPVDADALKLLSETFYAAYVRGEASVTKYHGQHDWKYDIYMPNTLALEGIDHLLKIHIKSIDYRIRICSKALAEYLAKTYGVEIKLRVARKTK